MNRGEVIFAVAMAFATAVVIGGTVERKLNRIIELLERDKR
jgi:hypothetical protein